MPFDKQKGIEARLARYRQIERKLVEQSDSAAELERLRVTIADLELQLSELEIDTMQRRSGKR